MIITSGRTTHQYFAQLFNVPRIYKEHHIPSKLEHEQSFWVRLYTQVNTLRSPYCVTFQDTSAQASTFERKYKLLNNVGIKYEFGKDQICIRQYTNARTIWQVNAFYAGIYFAIHIR